MSDQTDIEAAIISAMKLSCNEAFFFSEDETRLIDAEYLLTVNVAKKIVDLNTGIGIPYKIYLEKRTKEFASDCVPLMGKGRIRKSRKNTTRNGKIDVTVYRDGNFNGRPVCAIELKGFNPNRTTVLLDLKRNAEYFSLSCVTGDSQIDFSIFAALHSLKNTQTAASANEDRESLRTKYNNWLSELAKTEDYTVGIKVFTLSSSFLEEHIAPPDDEWFEPNSHHFAGVMVTFCSISKNTSPSDPVI